MIEHITCPHGGGIVHLVVDLWWIFVLCVPGVPWLLSKMGVIVRKCFCCKHSEAVQNVKCCDHDCGEEKGVPYNELFPPEEKEKLPCIEPPPGQSTYYDLDDYAGCQVRGCHCEGKCDPCRCKEKK